MVVAEVSEMIAVRELAPAMVRLTDRDPVARRQDGIRERRGMEERWPHVQGAMRRAPIRSASTTVKARGRGLGGSAHGRV